MNDPVYSHSTISFFKYKFDKLYLIIEHYFCLYVFTNVQELT